MSRAIIISCLSIIGCWTVTHAQGLDNYRKQREVLNQHITLLDNTLSGKQKERYSLTKNYQLIEKRIEQRERLQLTINQELQLTDSLITAATGQLESMGQMKSVRSTQMAYFLRKRYYHKLLNNNLLTWLSSKTIKDYLLKQRYNHQLTDHIRSSISDIRSVENSISDTIRFLQELRDEKVELLSMEEQNLYALQSEKETSQDMLKNLSQEESQIRAELQKQKEESARLNNIITKLIKEEEARSKLKETTESRAISGEFKNNKTKLPWPVDNAVVTDRFGVKQHPTLKNVRTQNLGIDMLCEDGAKVKTVYEGTVLIVTNQHPYNNIVIINHGEYTTAYFYLERAYVKKGVKVSTGEVIGELSKSGGQSDFHFEIWQNQKQVDPELWLRRR